MQEWFHCRTVLIKQLYWIEAAILASPVAILTSSAHTQREAEAGRWRARGERARERERHYFATMLLFSSQLHSAAIIFPALFPSSLLPSSIVPRKNTFAHNETDWVRTTRTPARRTQPRAAAAGAPTRFLENRHCCCWEYYYFVVYASLSAPCCMRFVRVLCSAEMRSARVVAIFADVPLSACRAICSIKFRSSAARYCIVRPTRAVWNAPAFTANLKMRAIYSSTPVHITCRR